ncbi:hypothetical protein [Gloeothece verrucosa]|nr:hypothetical protein [Gloeothece verrucosa]
MNYKTQPGLIAALKRATSKPMSVKLAWWFKQAEYALINNLGGMKSQQQHWSLHITPEFRSIGLRTE